VRLSAFEVDAIRKSFIKHFGAESHLWLFGSRVDDNKRGGDIDLYMQTTESDTKKLVQSRIRFLTDLDSRLGEQKIDLVIHQIHLKTELPIYSVAQKTGILLV